jgi:hypothetical protein
MNNRTHTKNMFKATAWIIGIAGAFLLVSAGIEFFVRQTVDQTSFPTILELLYVAFWSYVVGVVLLIVAPVWLFISWLRAWVKQYAVSTRTEVEPRSRRVEDSALGGSGFEKEAGSGFAKPSSESRVSDRQASELTQVA